MHGPYRIGGVGIGQKIYDSFEGGEGCPDSRAVRDRECAQRAAVIAAREGEEPAASGRVLRGLESGFDGLRSRVDELEAAEARGQDRREPVVQLGPKRRWQSRAGMDDPGVESARHGSAMCRVAVTEIAGSRAADEVEIALAGRRT